MSYLSEEQLNYIDDSILDTFESCGINSFPIDVFELCSKLHIVVKKYEDCSEKKRSALLQFSEDAVRVYNNKNKEFIIYYNSQIKSNRLNFSIMHEIGHIQLEHHIRNMSEELQEIEANSFAQRSLAPMGIILRLNLKNGLQIANTFNITPAYSQVIIIELNKILRNPFAKQIYINSEITKLFSEAIDAKINK